MGVDIEVHDCLDGPEKFPPQVQTTFGHRQPVNTLTLSYQCVTQLGWSIYEDDGEGGKLVKTTERKHRSEPEKRQQVGEHLSQAEKRREVLSESPPDTSISHLKGPSACPTALSHGPPSGGASPPLPDLPPLPLHEREVSLVSRLLGLKNRAIPSGSPRELDESSHILRGQESPLGA